MFWGPNFWKHMQDVPLIIAVVVHVYMCMLHAASKTKSGQTLKA
jgi:hypothetical protein